MKSTRLFAIAAALALGSAAARADGLFFTVPLIPGPSSQRATTPAQQPRPLMPQPSGTARERSVEREQPAVSLGERDATGRIAPTVPSARGDDGRLLPTHRSR